MAALRIGPKRTPSAAWSGGPAMKHRPFDVSGLRLVLVLRHTCQRPSSPTNGPATERTTCTLNPKCRPIALDALTTKSLCRAGPLAMSAGPRNRNSPASGAQKCNTYTKDKYAYHCDGAPSALLEFLLQVPPEPPWYLDQFLPFLHAGIRQWKMSRSMCLRCCTDGSQRVCRASPTLLLTPQGCPAKPHRQVWDEGCPGASGVGQAED